MNEQLIFDGMPEDHHVITTGHLYVCIGDNGTVKIGRTALAKGLARRLADHRKQDPSMRMVFSHIVDDYIRQETALKRQLADLAGGRVAGTEWYLLTAYSADLIALFMEHRGADTERMRQAFSANIADRTHRLAR